eukprot:scaffold2739_cov257-Pinguiococcus_pyrenoidosus.AAC.14
MSKKLSKGRKKRRERVFWTADEDQYIIDHVKKYGDKAWALLATSSLGRNNKQCRERYSSSSALSVFFLTRLLTCESGALAGGITSSIRVSARRRGRPKRCEGVQLGVCVPTGFPRS